MDSFHVLLLLLFLLLHLCAALILAFDRAFEPNASN